MNTHVNIFVEKSEKNLHILDEKKTQKKNTHTKTTLSCDDNGLVADLRPGVSVQASTDSINII